MVPIDLAISKTVLPHNTNSEDKFVSCHLGGFRLYVRSCYGRRRETSKINLVGASAPARFHFFAVC